MSVQTEAYEADATAASDDLARFRAEELITRREAVKAAITDVMRARLAAHGILVDTVSITDFDFSEEFTRAIEAKVTATQLALKAEAEALRVQKQQVTAELVQLRRIEAQMRAIEKWDGRLPQVETGSGPVPLLDVFRPEPQR